MRTREASVGLGGAAFTVGLLVAAGGAAAAVFCFLGSGLLLAALFGEAGPAPAPEGAVNESVGETADLTQGEPAASGADRSAVRSPRLRLGPVLFYYVTGLCLWSVVTVVAFAVT